LVFAVHPDDESLGAGGLIQQAKVYGADVRVVFITNGDNNPWPQRFVERRWRIDATARARWGSRRESEAVSALACLGVGREAISFWRYPDQGITDLLLGGTEELIEKFSDVISQWRPTLVVAPSLYDLHPDHSAAAVLLSFALARDDFDHPRPFHLMEYLIHSRGQELPGEAVELSLSREQIDLKRQAILAHRTQMALSRRRFLSFAKRTEIFFLPVATSAHESSSVSARFADGFLWLEHPRVTSCGNLLIATETSAGPLRLSIEVSSDGHPAVLDLLSGKSVPSAELIRASQTDKVCLPAALFNSAESCFVKEVSGRGFYDRSGWGQICLRRACNTEINAKQVGPQVCAVIPCYNLAEVCGPIVRAAAGYANHVIAVNDGSVDETAGVLRGVAADCPNVEVLNISHNGGKGLALLEAFRRATGTLPFDILITLDGDGQHRPEDIPRLAQALVEGNHAVVIGERLAREKMPLRSRVGNTITAGLMKLIHPSAPTDTQSGFRAFHRPFVHEIVRRITGGRYETELEILLLALREEKSIGSVTIPTVYLEGNRLSHFRPILDSCRIYLTLFRWQF
jgi:LmbE family N-acetylglucosaminyl deacetylase